MLIENISLKVPNDLGHDYIFPKGSKVDPDYFKSLYEECHTIVQENIKPQAIYENYDIDRVDDNRVSFQSGHKFNGGIVAQILTGCEMATIYILTLGQQLERKITEIKKQNDWAKTFILETISSIMLGPLSDYVGGIIREEGLDHPGWGTTCTYRPGQFKWSINEQAKLFSMIEGHKVGVTLNDGGMMIPFRSLSGVYGFGPQENLSACRVACQFCPRIDCPMRQS
jgi:hypothetical protein